MTTMNPEWSCFIYLAGDNLGKAVDTDLVEMVQAKPDKVNLAIQVDFPQTESLRQFRGQCGFEPFPIQLRPHIKLLNIKAKKRFVDFLKACIAHPQILTARHKAIIIYGHGGIVSAKFKVLEGLHGGRFRRMVRSVQSLFGIASEGADFLDRRDLDSGLKIGGPYDIIGCDACLMGTTEVAHQIRRRGKYFIASQDNEALPGWQYKDVLNSFGPQTSPKTVAAAIVLSYRNSMQDEPKATLSAVDLDAMDNVADALDDLGGALLPLIPAQIKPLAFARRDARTFTNYDYVDLRGFAQALKQHLPKANVSDQADRVVSAVNAAVLVTSNEKTDSRACGLSIYLPNAPVIEDFHHISLAREAPRWRDFVIKYGENR